MAIHSLRGDKKNQRAHQRNVARKAENRENEASRVINSKANPYNYLKEVKSRHPKLSNPVLQVLSDAKTKCEAKRLLKNHLQTYA